MLLQNLYTLFSINVAFPDVPATHAMCTDEPNPMSSGYCVLIKSQTAPLLFNLEDVARMISKKNLAFSFIQPMDCLQLHLSPFQMISGSEREVARIDPVYTQPPECLRLIQHLNLLENLGY